MDQVSRPLLIVLAATVCLMAVWVVALRPKPPAVESTPLAPTQAIPKANQASAISDAANAKLQAATGNEAPSAAQPAAPSNAAAPQKAATPRAAPPVSGAKRAVAERRNAAILGAVKQGRVVVLLFWNPDAADDVATRGALRLIDRHGGKVAVRVAPISDVASYTSVTRGVKIAQSPTTVIIGRKGRTRVIAGLTEPKEISQAVSDALAGR